MTLYLALICGPLATLVAIVSAASIELSASRSVTSLASDAKAYASSHLRLQEAEASAVIAMINAFPRLGLLPSISHAIRIFSVAV